MFKKVFDVSCWWDDDAGDIAHRYVVASDEFEVEEKMLAYALELEDSHCATLHWDLYNCEVELDSVLC